MDFKTRISYHGLLSNKGSGSHLDGYLITKRCIKCKKQGKKIEKCFGVGHSSVCLFTDVYVSSLATNIRLNPCFLKPVGPVARLNIAAVMKSSQI